MAGDDSKHLLLGNIAIELGFLSERQVEDGVQEQMSSVEAEPLGRIFVRRGILSSAELGRILEEQVRRMKVLSEQLRADRKLLDFELRMARQVQLHLIPKEFPSLEGLDLAAYYKPAEAVGGDFYDVGQIDPQRFYVTIGDVSGRGVPAAMIMGMVTSLIRMVSRSTVSPSEILNQVNGLLNQQLRKGTFVTLLYLWVDGPRREACLASAGHNPALALTREGEVLELKTEGGALGMLQPEVFYDSIRELRLELSRFRKILLYTDGVTEAMDGDHRPFGKQRVLELLSQTGDLSAEGTLAHVLGELRQHCGGRDPEDDVAMIILSLR